MSAIKTEAIVLRHRRFSESSLIATLLSRDHGRLDVLAKGARREKGPLFGHLDLYQREEVLVFQRSQAGLDLLTEAAFIDEHAGLRFLPSAFAATGFLADLAAEVTLPGDTHRELFDVMASAFRLLSDLGDAAGRAGLASSEPFSNEDKTILVGRTLKLAVLDMLGWLGYGLELKRCVVCGSTPDGRGTVFLSRRHGGLVCGSCRARAGDGVPIKPAALASLRDRGEGAGRHEMRLEAGERRRWLRFLVDYCQHALEKPLRGKKVLFQLLEA